VHRKISAETYQTYPPIDLSYF